MVTGGASGLGLSTAQYLTSLGAKVTILDLNFNLAQKVASEIGVYAVECDVTSEESVQNALSKIETKNGIPRILVNCAGISHSSRIVSKKGPMPLKDFEKVIRINLIGSFNMIRLTAHEIMKLDPLEDGERGVIISTASIAAYEGQIGQVAYAASKGGINSMVLPAAREFAQFGIRVNAIAPGLFQTPLIENITKESRDTLASKIPFPKRLGLPIEYAKLVSHVIENRYLNGVTIRIDGALRMEGK